MITKNFKLLIITLMSIFMVACGIEDPASSADPNTNPSTDVVNLEPQPAATGDFPKSNLTGEAILGNPDYQAISYGAWRSDVREAGLNVPSVDEQKEDLQILAAMGIKVLRTYNTQGFIGLDGVSNTENLLEAIKQTMDEDPNFEMYVMLGVWIDAKNSWTDQEVIHDQESDGNALEITAAIELAKAYPEIVKVIAVGNEAMVHWAPYHVAPGIILKHVNALQELKVTGEIDKNIWITSSDNHASWTGAGDYANPDLDALINAVDYISVHTYPFHDTHYDSAFWKVPADEEGLTAQEKIDSAMVRAKNHALSQVAAAQAKMLSLGVNKQIHVGETGWATVASSGGADLSATGSGAADEYKQKAYYDAMREWSNEFGASLFFFEGFDEPWKGDPSNSDDSEKHFGLIDINGKAKYLLWDLVDAGAFDNLARGTVDVITKSYDGDVDTLMLDVVVPPSAPVIGGPVTDASYVVSDSTLRDDVQLNGWEGTSEIAFSGGVITVTTGTGQWWGAGVELNDGASVNLADFSNGTLQFDIKGDTSSSFNIGFQTGSWSAGTQVNNFVTFGPAAARQITGNWVTHSIAISELDNGADLTDVTGAFAFMGVANFDGKTIEVRNISFNQE